MKAGEKDTPANLNQVPMTELAPISDQYIESLSLESELINQETVWLQNFTSKHTQKAYSFAFREFCALSGINSPQGFRASTDFSVIQYRDYLINRKKLSNRGVRNRLAALSSCFKHLQARGIVKANPVEGIQRPKVDESIGETPVMTSEQVRLLLKQPDTRTLQGARDSAFLHLLFYSGTRIGAPGTIKVKDFYLDKGFYVLKWRKKGGQNQIIPVHPELQGALLHYLAKSEHSQDQEAPLFAPVKTGNNKGDGLSNKQFDRIWNKYRQIAGLPEQFTPHSARATFATTANDNNVPVQDIQKSLSHANVATTMIYIHDRKEHKDSAVFKVNY